MSNHFSRLKQLRLTLSLAAIALVFAPLFDSSAVWSQITPDSTLGESNSRVIPDQNINNIDADLIEGGAQRGANLFHSFGEFNIEAGRGAYFANPEGVNNIFNRVTGNNASQLSGTLGILGDANLYFINPNGIIFGENSSLDINGSFVGTTANGIEFGDRGFFSASEPENVPLLTIQPSALFFDRLTGGKIINRSRAETNIVRNLEFQPEPAAYIGLNSASNSSFLLLAEEIITDTGNVVIEGGGRIELVAIAEPVDIELNFDDSNPAFKLDGSFSKGDILFRGNTNLAAEINLLGDSTRGTEAQNNSGEINLVGKNITLTGGAFINVSNVTNINSPGIFIKSQNLFLGTSDNSIASIAEGTVDGTDILIETETLSQKSNNGINIIGAVSDSSGEPGDLIINAEDIDIVGNEQLGDVPFDARSIFINGFLSEASSNGNSGNIIINTDRLSVSTFSVISATNIGGGDAGNIEINAKQIILDKSAIFTDSFRGNAGNINLKVAETLQLRNNGEISTSTAPAFNNIPDDITATIGGRGGNINIEAGFVVAPPTENSDIVANAINGRGGEIKIDALGIFGIEPNTRLTPLSDITAFSRQNPELNGTTTIDIPEQNIGRETLNIPLPAVDTTIPATCDRRSVGGRSQFVVTGKGGTSDSPRGILKPNIGWEDWGTERSDKLTGESTNFYTSETIDAASQKQNEEIVEASQWRINDRGNIVLIAGKTPKISLKNRSCYSNTAE